MDTYRKKLIEVDLPLDVINSESVREKGGTKPGLPSTLHRYWARRPLAACRAIIFASMVDDPSACEEFQTPEEETKERKRLHEIIERLVVWQNSNDEDLLAEARYEIARSVARNNRMEAPTDPDAVLAYLREHCPAVYDPFCGGGSIPLEAQRLGLRARASDLNPLPVLINKAMIELPPQFHNRKPINPDADPLGMFIGKGRKKQQVPWRGNAGLADDIRYYGAWMRDKAHKQIGHLYPKVKLADGSKATVIAWLWARTVPCANPACGINMPLMKTFQLSSKKGNQYWTRPVVDRDTNKISFVVQNHSNGIPEHGTVHRGGAFCITCGDNVKLEYVREQARQGKMKKIMTAIVAEGERRRIFLSPTSRHIHASLNAKAAWEPRGDLPEKALGISLQNYGIAQWHQLFTERQLSILTTFSEALTKAHNHIKGDGAEDDYANTLCTYLAITISKSTDSGCSAARWEKLMGVVAPTFGRQAIPITWDFAEVNPFSSSTQNWMSQIEAVANVVERLPASANNGEVYQADASSTMHADDGPIILTDPPYYNNIGYADLSDFFYIWMRPMLRDIYPGLFAGMMTPKDEEMVAAPRFKNPRKHFEELLVKALLQMRKCCSSEFPSSIFYAYKQQEEERDGKTSTGWETMLNAVVSAGFQIVGTWPMRTERSRRPREQGANALASSVVLVCRPRPADAPVASRRDFLDELKEAMQPALDQFTREGHIAPVDLAQAAIGPGMEVYSRYSRVERDSGETVPVREALTYINREIEAYYEQEEGDFDSETRFCVAWLKQYGYAEGRFGEAEVLAIAKVVSIDSMARLLISGGGIVQLRAPDGYYEEVEREEAHKVRTELPLEGITTAWEGCMHMIFHLNLKGGKTIEGAAEVAEAMHNNPDCCPLSSVERLARLLYNHYDQHNQSKNAVYFNNLVTSWDKIMSEMEDPKQHEMF